MPFDGCDPDGGGGGDLARIGKAALMLDLLIEFFEDGAKWLDGDFHDKDGRRCLVGAMAHLRAKHRISGDATRRYLQSAIVRNVGSRKPRPSLIEFNDDHEFPTIEIVLRRARDNAHAEFKFMQEVTARRGPVTRRAVLGGCYLACW